MVQDVIIPFQENIIQRFRIIFDSGRLAHAYLFVGPPDSGKKGTALALAKLVNCLNLREKLFCDECSACIKINHGSHPDIHLVKSEEGDSIKIEQVRKLIYEIQLKSFEAKKKVFVIEDAEQLTTEAANALLKTLEEPLDNSLLILTTSALEKNLETIRSRCQAVQFFPLSALELKEKLIRFYQLSPQTAHFLAYYAEGSLGKAKSLYDQKIFERKNDVIDRFIISECDEETMKKVVSDKEFLKNVLHVLLLWFRDLTLLKLGAPSDQMVHQDRMGDLERMSSRFSPEHLSEVIQEIVKTKAMLDDNLNIKIGMALLQEKLWRKLSK